MRDVRGRESGFYGLRASVLAQSGLEHESRHPIIRLGQPFGLSDVPWRFRWTGRVVICPTRRIEGAPLTDTDEMCLTEPFERVF